MPTTKPRMIITLEPQTKEILDQLADASGQPASRFVSELLKESAEALFLPMIEALKLAKNKKIEAWDVLNSALSKSQYSAAQLSLAIHEAKREHNEKPVKRRKNATKN
jgi:uncharacterized protein (DUF1778 family)